MKRKAPEEAAAQTQQQKVAAHKKRMADHKEQAQHNSLQQAQEEWAEKKLEADKLKVEADKLKLVDEQKTVDRQRRVAEKQVAQLMVDAKEMEAKVVVARQVAAEQYELAEKRVAQLLVKKQELTTQEQQLETQEKQLETEKQQVDAKQVAKIEDQQPQLETAQILAELKQHAQTVAKRYKEMKSLWCGDLKEGSSRRQADALDAQIQEHLKLLATRTHQLSNRYPPTGISTGWSEAVNTFISFQYGRLRDARPALSPSELVMWGERLWSIRGQEERIEWFDFAKHASFKVITSKEFQTHLDARRAMARFGVASLVADGIVLPEVILRSAVVFSGRTTRSSTASSAVFLD